MGTIGDILNPLCAFALVQYSAIDSMKYGGNAT